MSSSAPQWADATIKRAASEYVDFQQRITAATTPEEIALRNAMIDHPLTGRVSALYRTEARCQPSN